MTSRYFSIVGRNFRVLIFALSFSLIFVTTGWAQDGGTWETRAPMSVYRQELVTGGAEREAVRPRRLQ
jgi:hypothetical protein